MFSELRLVFLVLLNARIVDYRFFNKTIFSFPILYLLTILYLFCPLDRLIEITGIRKEKHKIIDITCEKGTAQTVVETRINCNSLLEKVQLIVDFYVFCLLSYEMKSFRFLSYL